MSLTTDGDKDSLELKNCFPIEFLHRFIFFVLAEQIVRKTLLSELLSCIYIYSGTF